MKANRPQQPQEASDRVRLIVFDFDQTLSVFHVFKTLAGWSKDAHFQVPKPFAMTERGQVRRIGELSQQEPFRRDGGFAMVAFGGEARLEVIRELLERLRAQGVTLVICTKGLAGAVRKCLSDVGLLGFFSEVYGNVGNNYGETPYDQELARVKLSSREAQFISTPERSSWKSKDKLIVRLANQAGLSREQAVLVEDDAEEIRRAGSVCRTLWVREAAGMTNRHCSALLQLAEGGQGSASGSEEVRLPRSSDSRFSGGPGRLEARLRDGSARGPDCYSKELNNSGGPIRRFEEAPGNMSLSEGMSHMEQSRRLELEMARLSLDSDCIPAAASHGRRSKSCTDGVSKANRCPARPSSRGTNSRHLQALGQRFLEGNQVVGSRRDQNGIFHG